MTRPLHYLHLHIQLQPTNLVNRVFYIHPIPVPVQYINLGRVLLVLKTLNIKITGHIGKMAILDESPQ